MSETGEVDGTCSCITQMNPCAEHPSGIYVCNCKKMFHGHMNMDWHSATCPVMVEARNQAIIKPALSAQLATIAKAVGEKRVGYEAYYDSAKTLEDRLMRAEGLAIFNMLEQVIEEAGSEEIRTPRKGDALFRCV